MKQRLFIAREPSGRLELFHDEPPTYSTVYNCWTGNLVFVNIDWEEFPEVTFENSPVEVELKIKEK